MQTGSKTTLSSNNLSVHSAIDPILTRDGGIPRGVLVEFFGPESAGKTTLLLLMIAKTQKAGGKAAYLDLEHALDFEYAKFLGVDLDELYYSEPLTGEEAFEEVFKLVREGYWLIGIDSVPCLIPEEVIEKRAGLASNSRLVSTNLGILISEAKKYQTTVVFINQIRDKFNVRFGRRTTTPGGHALKHLTVMRLEIHKTGYLKYGDKVIGFKAKIRTEKNKKYPPYKEAEIEVIFDSEAPSLEVINKRKKTKITTEDVKGDN
jgi:recombination protein RecA